MPNDNVRAVERYFDALRDHDSEAVAALLSDAVLETVPLAPNGLPEAWFVYTGKEEVLAYVATIFSNFSQVELRDREVNSTDDGRVVFVETNGDLIVAATDTPYRNVYVFRFTFDADGLITDIREYANPVPIAHVFGVPVG